MARFKCPACQKILKAPDEASGRKTHCPRCGQQLLIPSPVQAQADNKTNIGEPASSAPYWLDEANDIEEKPEPLSLRRPPPGHALFECPTCHSTMNVAAASIGRMVHCPQCGTSFAASKEETISDNSSAPAVDQVEVLEAVDAEADVPSVRQRSNKSKKFRTSRGAEPSGCVPAAFMGIGLMLSLFGCLTTLGNWLGSSTTVRSSSLDQYSEQVHNVGLMNDRVVGVVVGVGFLLGGLILFVGGFLGGLLEYLPRRES
jgi:DNA-directed RNA polymerase subunit M/transcription elongation factor TFIIS